MSAPALVIFDCDGVLVDSEPIANAVFAEHLARVGLDWGPRETERRLVGLSLARCVEIVEAELGRALPEDFLERLQAETFEAFRGELQPVPGIEQALDALDELPRCVASSGSLDKMRFTLGTTGLLPRFEGRLYSASQVERGKPAPDLFLHAAAQMGVAADACVVVEDSLPGVQAGVAAGMRVVGYVGRGDAEALARAGAETIATMEQLEGVVR